MEVSKDKIEALRKIIEGGRRKMVVVSHTNPDGDAVGSSLAWGAMLEEMGHEVSYIVPNNPPSFLMWMEGAEKLGVFKADPEKQIKIAAEAEVIFCMDFNQVDRLEGLCDAIKANRTAVKVLIDHHLNPPKEFDIEFSYPHSSSTAFLTYRLISEIKGEEFITKSMAENMYVGMMTDTGSFSFSYLTPELFRAVAVLVEKGVDIPQINRKVYHSFTAERVKLLGYALNKMEITSVGKGDRIAYITLTEAELRRYNFQPGDSEGFVNYPLSIADLSMSAVFIETRNFIRISFRSKGDVDVSLFASKYFGGGGHKNASGGKSFVDMEQTIKDYLRYAAEFFG